MKRTAIVVCALLSLGVAGVSGAATPKSAASGEASKAAAQAAPPHDQSAVSHGSVTVGGKTIRYTATAGTLVLKNKDGKPMASMSYVAYTKDGVKPADRPLTFLYNGGPGSSTVWLHMLAFGPKKVVVGSGTLTPPAPYQLVNNNDSLLDASDLVFIDAPGTGFGRVIGKDEGGAGTGKDVYGVDEDAKAFAQFITRYLTLNSRWNSPKFLFGESYGTTRSAVLANILENDDSVGLNGVMLLSAILDYDISVDFPQINPGANNLSYVLGLPSYAATAWYHHKLPQQPADLDAFLKQVEQFATTDYAQALMQGTQLDPATKQKIAEQIHQYTGLPEAYVLKANLRVSGGQFAHELLGADDEITGRLDSRYSGPAINPMGEDADYDPLDSAIDAPTVAEFNDYVRNTLHFGKDLTYKPQIDVFKEWDFKHMQPGAPFPLPALPNVMPDLASAMKHDPQLYVLLLGGYFDLGTPFYSAEYEMHQLTLPAKLERNISYQFFPSGHMVYLNPESHDGLHAAAAAFIDAHYRH
ncbi:MAG: Carboxypeptidase-related protein [Rhodanobacteraceae bacterium]|jgi:carboxypeptidase C (cathepsin A)|nr:MAG: Carboxypeptidase-related protein [Rhodanobacteraceae bacterium]